MIQLWVEATPLHSAETIVFTRVVFGKYKGCGMSNCMVKLRPSQQKARLFKHPLLDDAPPPLTEAQLAVLIPEAISNNKEARDELIIGHLSMLRNTVSRYLYHWPLTRRFRDEMVSVGLYTLTRVVTDLTEDTLDGRLLGPYLLNHICKHIEIEIASLRGIAPAPMRTNQRRMQNGQPPIFGEVIADIQHSIMREGYYYIEEGFEELETLEIIDKLRVESHHYEVLLNEEYWGLTDWEVSQRTGIPRQTIHWYRTELLKRYQELVGD